ncbi:hypothetical protein ACIBH1_32530 [Nonomuraea sp. NPDC050663]|uniref:hypothetical protein n=1 Tax=Nonomuraea sp. NPDC050663 TaxID=3364370 RepID=UPI0037975C70
MRLRDGKHFLAGLRERPKGAEEWEVDALAVDVRLHELMKKYRVEWLCADPCYW